MSFLVRVYNRFVVPSFLVNSVPKKWDQPLVKSGWFVPGNPPQG